MRAGGFDSHPLHSWGAGPGSYLDSHTTSVRFNNLITGSIENGYPSGGRGCGFESRPAALRAAGGSIGRARKNPVSPTHPVTQLHGGGSKQFGYPQQAIAGSNPAPLAHAGGVAKRPKAPVSNTESQQHIRRTQQLHHRVDERRLPHRLPVAMPHRGKQTTLTAVPTDAHHTSDDTTESRWVDETWLPDMWFQYHPPLRRGDPGLTTHPSSTTQYCGGSTTLGYLDGSTPPLRLGAGPRWQGNPSSEGSPRASPHIRHSDLFTGRNVVGYLSLLWTQPRLRHTHP